MCSWYFGFGRGRDTGLTRRQKLLSYFLTCNDQLAIAAVKLHNKSLPSGVIYNIRHKLISLGVGYGGSLGWLKWWDLVPGFGIHGPHFELQASHLQHGSHYEAHAEVTEAT